MRGLHLFFLIVGFILVNPLTCHAVSPSQPQTHDHHGIPDIVVGSEKAPIKVIEYSSLTCHHCAQFHKNVLPVLLSKYIKKGEMQLIFRHFPIDLYALKASAIVVTSPSIRQFSLVNKLFETQELWASENYLEAFARLAGTQAEECRKTVEDKALLDRLLKARLEAEKTMKIDATPTFFINGRVIDHAPTLSEIEEVIRPYLSATS